MRQRDRRGHQLGRLVRGIAEHHALVAGATGINSLGNVARLFVDARDHRAGVGIESVERIVVANRGHHSAHQALEIYIGLGGDFTCDHHQSGGGQGFSCHTAVGILIEACIEDGIGHLVGNLVRMAFGNRLRGKQKSIAQLHTPSRVYGSS